MNHLLDDPPTVHWIIVADRDRWRLAVHRFAYEGLQKHLALSIESTVHANSAEYVSSLFTQTTNLAVLWDLDNRTLSNCFSKISRISIARPDIIQLAAISQISQNYQLNLMEIGVSIVLRHPESLQRVARQLNQRWG